MQYLAVGVRCLIGVVFAASSIGKLARRGGLAAFTGAVRHTGFVPWRAGRPVAVAVLLLEALVALSVAMPARPAAVAGLVGAAALLAAFTLVVARLVRAGSDAPCGCFGASSVPPGPIHLIRNILLTALAAVGAVAAADPIAARPTGTAVAAAAGLALGGLTAALDQLRELFQPVGPARR